MSGFIAGDVVMTSQPYAFVILASERKAVCERCWVHMKREGDVLCAVCGMVYYCGDNCREEDKEDHARECNVLKINKGTKINDQVRLILRIWLKYREEGGDVKEGSDSARRGWNDLMDHASRLEKDSGHLLQQIHQQLATVLPEKDLPDAKMLTSIYGKILTNSFSLRTDRFSLPSPFGTGVYLSASILDHSCTPNTTVVFRGRALDVMATEDIPPGDVKETCFISYVNILDDIKMRQRQHRGIWYFTCECTLCCDTSLDSEKHSMFCLDCGSGRPVDTVAWSQPRPCTHCKAMDKVKDRAQLEKYKQLYKLLEEGNNEMSEEELAEWAIGEMEEVFHPRDILYVKTCHFVHQVALTSGRWEAALVYGEMALPMFKLYYGDKAGVVAAFLVRLGQAAAGAGDDLRAVNYLEEADAIYRVVPGNNHPFYTKDFLPLLNKLCKL